MERSLEMKKENLLKGEEKIKVCSKENSYFGNRYCLMIDELLPRKDYKGFNEINTTIEELVNQRLKLLKEKSLEEALKKSNAMGVKRRLNGKSVLKLSNSVYLDRKYTDLFNDCTYWYHKKDNNVYVISKDNKILGLIAKIKVEND